MSKRNQKTVFLHSYHVNFASGQTNRFHAGYNSASCWGSVVLTVRLRPFMSVSTEYVHSDDVENIAVLFHNELIVGKVH